MADWKNVKKLITLLAVACVAATAAQAQQPTATPVKKVVKKPVKKTKAVKETEPKPGTLVDEDGKEFVAGSAAVTDVVCELGNKVTLYRNAGDTEHMALRWNQRVHRMTRVSTSTGANRFENSRYGLVWIGIPAKGMLLDAKKGQQLANECKDPDQLAPQAPVVQAAEAPAPAVQTPVVLELTAPANLPPPAEAPRDQPK